MKTAAFGTILAFGDGATPEVFHKLANVKDISGPKMSRETIDVTTHDSPDGYKEFLASLRDGGEITFDLEFDPADASQDATDGLLSLWHKDVPTNWKLITMIPATTGRYGFSFSALVTGVEFAHPVSSSHTVSVTLKVAGAVSDPTDMPTTGLV